MRKLCNRKSLLNLMLVLAMAFAFSMFANVDAKAATAPTGLKQTDDGTGSIEVEWMAQLDNDIHYEVSVSTDNRNWVVKEEDTTSNSEYIYGLNAGTTYYVRVRAYVGSGYTGYSASLECVTAPNSATSSISKVGSTTSSINMSWAAVPGANAYSVTYYADYSYRKSVIVATNSANLTGLAKNTEYSVNVTSLRKAASTGYIAEGSTKYTYDDFGVTPSKLTGVEVDYYWQSSKQIDVISNRVESATGYQYEVWTAYTSKDKKIMTKDSTSCSFNYLKKNVFGKNYMFKLRGRAYTTNTNGTKVYGAWSSWTYTCPQPDVTKMTSTSSGLKVKYDSIKGAKKYAVYVSTKQKSGYKKVATTNKTTYTITKFNKKALKKGKTYYVYVVPYNKSGKAIEAGNADSCWYLKYTK